MSVFKEIPLSEIVANQYQPRLEFDDLAIDELAKSIKENGLIQPITVRAKDDGYELIAGERRLRACKANGFETIGAYVIEANEVQSAQMALVENIQRENLSPIEEANGYLQILRLTGMTQQQLAAKTGKTQSNIANKLRLLNLDVEVIQAIDNKTISERHGRALLGLNSEQQRKALAVITNNGYNVTKTEEYVKRISEPKKKSKVRCFGVSGILLVNEIKETIKRLKQLSSDIKLEESQSDDSYIMTITIKK